MIGRCRVKDNGPDIRNVPSFPHSVLIDIADFNNQVTIGEMGLIYQCPTHKNLMCSWGGSSSNILEHFIEEHENLYSNSCEMIINFGLISENRLLFVKEEVFLVQLNIRDEYLSIALRFLGPSSIASKFRYDICLEVEQEEYSISDYFGEHLIFWLDGDGTYSVNLRSLKVLHDDIYSCKCIFNIKCASNEISPVTDTQEIVNMKDNESAKELIIEDEMIIESVTRHESDIEIIDESRNIVEKRKNKSNDESIDKFGTLNLSLLEKQAKCRRFSSFVGIPPDMFREVEEKNLSCASCFLSMLPPIYLCERDHSVCGECRNDKCKSCYGLVTENRNRDLEKLSRESLHPCRYRSVGCTEGHKYNEIRAHELRCGYCIYNCFNYCKFEGKFSQMNSHLKLHHPSYKVVSSNTANFPPQKEFLFCEASIGVFHCKSSTLKNNFRWSALYLGPKERKFSCELSFKGGKLKDNIYLNDSAEVSKEDLRRMKVKAKNAVLTIIPYNNDDSEEQKVK